MAISACKDSTSSQDEEPVEGSPATPTGFLVMPGDGEVTLTWDANSEADLSHYNVYQGTASGNLSKIAEIPVGTETFTAADLTNGMTYYFAIDAENTESKTSKRTEEANALPVAKYFVQGSALSGYGGNLVIIHKNEGVEGATVLINGEILEDKGNGRYYKYPFDRIIPEGGELELEITIGDAMITATGLVPSQPSLTAPADSSSYSSDEIIPVTWTIVTDPDRFDVLGNYITDSGGGTSRGLNNVGGELRQVDLPANKFPNDGRDIELHVVAWNDGEFSGPFAEGSTMGIRAISSEDITIFVTE